MIWLSLKRLKEKKKINQKEIKVGKIIKTILATEDNDPMGLLGTYDVFSPKKYTKKNENKKIDKKKLILKKNKK